MIQALFSKYFIYSTTDVNGIITDVSDAFCIVSGYSRDELIGQSHNIIRHPDMPKKIFEEMWKAITQGNNWQGELKNKKKDGGYFWVDCVIEPILGLDGDILGYKAVRFDITSKKELEAAMIEKYKSLVIYEKFFYAVNVGLAVSNKDGVITRANHYLANLLGFLNADDVVGLNCNELTSEQYRDANEKCLNKAYLTDEPISIVKQCKKNDGKYVWVESVFQKIDHNEILLSIKNIDSYKKLEEASVIITNQSRQAAMGEMLSMIAHQWRQPLGAISIITTKMGIRYKFNEYTDESFDEDLYKIQEVVQHLSKTIEFFRNYFKEKDGSKITIKELFGGIMTVIAPLASVENVHIELDILNFQKLMIDNRLDQVLINLYKNAIEAFTYSGIKNNKMIHTSIEQIDDTKINITITDNAGGIPSEIIQKVFEPYFSTKSKNGTGLGLYMSRKIVQDIFDGDLTVKNTQSGTCFTISAKISPNKLMKGSK